MNLEKVTVVLRPRKPMEAIDLGFAMARAWARPLWSLWFKTATPLFFVVWMSLVHHPWWSIFATWWIRPLFDHSLLFYISRALFGAPPAPAEAVRGTLGLWRRFALSSLTVFRLDPTRSFRMPIRQLEALRGADRRERSRVLGAAGQEFAVLLTIVCLIIEVCFFGSLIAIAYMFIPSEVRFDLGVPMELWITGEGSLLMHSMMGTFFFLAVSLVEPFFVAAGFALYINRRTLLEGWDIELSFRHLARRLEREWPQEISIGTGVGDPERVGAPGVAGVVLLVLLSSGLFSPAIARAQDSVPAERDPNEVITEILAGEEFGGEESVKSWKYVGPKKEKDPEVSDVDLSWLNQILGAVGGVFEVLLWCIVVVAFGLLVWALFRFGGSARALPASSTRAPPPDVVFGLDVTEESLPEDIAGEALALLRAGRITDALSLLYRGTLAALIHRHEVVIEASWTEGECLRELDQKLTPDRHAFFAKLTEFWCTSAYAHRDPAASELEALCMRWPGLFKPTPASTFDGEPA